MAISWKCTNEDFDLMVAIARRANLPDQEYRQTLMDLNAVHANGNPLDLAGLLAANDGDFAHDVSGIRHHIDRETGKLTECFTPRWSAAEKQEKQEPEPEPEPEGEYVTDPHGYQTWKPKMPEMLVDPARDREITTWQLNELKKRKEGK